MALTPRDRRAVLIGAAVIAAGLALRVVVMPAVGHWRDLRAVVALGEERIVAVEQKFERRDAMVARQRVRFGPGVEKPLEPAERVRVGFPQAVQKALSAGGLGVTSIEPQGVRKLREAPGVVLVSLRVHCAGDADALPKSLAAIQQSESLIIVDRFDVSMPQPGNRGQWSVNMQLSTPALEVQE